MKASRLSKRSRKNAIDENSDDDDVEKDEESEHQQTQGRGKRRKITKSTKLNTGRSHDDIAQDLDKEIEDAMGYFSDKESDEVVNDENKSDCDAGQILQIEVENFMCHKKLTVRLGKGVNFITGKNGSGKSAIVAAIQLCLGGNARTTGRGTAMGSLVKEGSNESAIARVTLRNTGVDAFNPKVYGEKIIVERRINRTGQTEYALYDHQKKKISNQKSELDKILRSFNILVDNPCCILTQDESKKFIHGKDHDKYQFFLKATGLHNLKEEYIEDIKNLEEAERNRAIHEEKIQKKREEVSELKQKLDKLVRLDKLQEEIKLSQVKLFWIDVREQERQIEEISAEIERMEESLQETRAEFTSACSRAQEKTNEIEQLTQELNTESRQIDEAMVEINAIQRQVAESEQRLHIQKSQLQARKRAKQELQDRLLVVENEIQTLRNKAMQSASIEEKKFLEKLDSVRSKIEQLQKQELELRDQKTEIGQSYYQLKNEDDRLRTQRGSLTTTITTLENQLRTIESNSGSSLSRFSRYGKEFVEFMQQVSRTSSFQGVVLGPIAAHVSIREGHQRYELAIERALGAIYRSFIVTNDQDREKLFQLMKRCDLRGVNIIQQTPYPAGRYPIRHPARESEEVLTVEKAIQVDDDLVYNVLVDHAYIESTALIQKELVDLDTVLEKVNHIDRFKYQISAAIDMDGVLISIRAGNRSSEQMKATTASNIFSADQSQYKNNLLQSIQEKRTEYQTITEQISKVSQQLQQVQHRQQQIQQLTTNVLSELKKCNKERVECEQKINDISEANRIDTTPLESEVDELRQQIASEQTSIENLQLEINQSEVQHKEKLEEKKRADAVRSRLKAKCNEIDAKIQNIVHAQLQARKVSTGLEKMLSEREKELDREQQKKEQLTAKRMELLETAVKNTLKEYPDWNDDDDDNSHSHNHNRSHSSSSSSASGIVEVIDGDSEEDDRPQQKTNETLETFRRPKLLNKDTRQYIEREIQKMRADYHQTMKVAGMAGQTVDQLRKNYQTADKQLQETEKTLALVQSNIQKTQADAQLRKERWKKELLESTRLTKRKFDHYVREKGSAGDIKFNHKDGKLEVAFQVDNADGSSVRNDVRNLSGGERSFVTFSLLLALGHVIESPFRLMDEYDVYLDEPSRKLTLDQLQRYARQPKQHNRQFIILTPHTLGDICTGPFVRIFRMPDPTRISAHGPQQQVLNFDEN